MEKHINVIGVLWIVSGVLGLLMALMVFAILFGISFIPEIEFEASVILRTIGIGAGVFFAIFSIPDIIAGVWLMKRAEWARIFVIILSFLNLLLFPLGTALGIYSIVILMREDTARLFR